MEKIKIICEEKEKGRERGENEMTRKQAHNITIGDEITFGPHVYKVEDVCTTPDPPLDWPFFRIKGWGIRQLSPMRTSQSQCRRVCGIIAVECSGRALPIYEADRAWWRLLQIRR